MDKIKKQVLHDVRGGEHGGGDVPTGIQEFDEKQAIHEVHKTHSQVDECRGSYERGHNETVRRWKRRHAGSEEHQGGMQEVDIPMDVLDLMEFMRIQVQEAKKQRWHPVLGRNGKGRVFALRGGGAQDDIQTRETRSQEDADAERECEDG